MPTLRDALAALVALPAVASAAIVLSVAPLARFVPPALAQAIAPAASLVFGVTARLPPRSLAGEAFYGSYALLVPLFGANALAAHALLLALPWLALAWLLRHPHRRAREA